MASIGLKCKGGVLVLNVCLNFEFSPESTILHYYLNAEILVKLNRRVQV